MVEYIKEQDSLNTGRKTINEELTRSNNNANKAKIDSAEALLKAIASMDLSESVRNQLNQIVIEGDSSVEAAAARVDEKNVTHDTLKERIDDGFLGVTSQLNEIAIQSTLFKIQVPEVDDTGRIQRAFDSLHDGDIILLNENINISSTLELISKKGVIVVNKSNSIIKKTQGIPLKLSNCYNVTLMNVNIDGSKSNQRGIELVNSPLTRIYGGKITNIGSEIDEVSTAGVIIKEGCDFSVVKGLQIERIYSQRASAGVWIENFSNSTDPKLMSKHILIDNIHVSDISPNKDADGVKILSGNYLENVNLIVQNSTFVNCRKRGLKFQARGCKSINNYIEFNEPNSHAEIDFQRGSGLSQNDTMTVNITVPLDVANDNLYYIGVNIAGASVELDGFEIQITNNHEQQYITRGPLSRAVRMESLENQIVKDINIHNCNLIGHTIEFTTDVTNFTFKDNEFTILRGEPVTQNGKTLTNFVWRDNEQYFLGSTVNVLYVKVNGGYIDVNINDNIERYLPPLHRDSLTEYRVRMAVSSSPLNYQIVNDICISSVPGYPQTSNASRYNNLFKYAKVGDIAFKSTPTTGTDENGKTFYEDRWVCIAEPDETNVRGTWRTVRTYLT